MLTFLMPFLKEYGFPAIIAMALLYTMDQQRKEAAKERADHTIILVNQMYELRLACGKYKRAAYKGTDATTPATFELTEPELPLPDVSAITKPK